MRGDPGAVPGPEAVTGTPQTSCRDPPALVLGDPTPSAGDQGENSSRRSGFPVGIGAGWMSPSRKA